MYLSPTAPGKAPFHGRKGTAQVTRRSSFATLCSIGSANTPSGAKVLMDNTVMVANCAIRIQAACVSKGEILIQNDRGRESHKVY